MSNFFDRFFAGRINQFTLRVLDTEFNDNPDWRAGIRIHLNNYFESIQIKGFRMEECILDENKIPHVEISRITNKGIESRTRDVNTFTDGWILETPVRMFGPDGTELREMNAIRDYVSNVEHLLGEA